MKTQKKNLNQRTKRAPLISPADDKKIFLASIILTILSLWLFSIAAVKSIDPYNQAVKTQYQIDQLSAQINDTFDLIIRNHRHKLITGEVVF